MDLMNFARVKKLNSTNFRAYFQIALSSSLTCSMFIFLLVFDKNFNVPKEVLCTLILSTFEGTNKNHFACLISRVCLKEP